MTRTIIQQILLFALPFVAYFAYRLLANRGQGFLQNTPWFSLASAGLILTIMGFVTLGLVGGSSPDGRYIPPSYQDGEIVPGRVVPKE